jgi:tetratricopeptide (TPR) repeat protein
MDGYDQYDEALACFDRALQLDPGALLAWLGKASALGDLERNEEALACFDHVLKLDPENGSAFVGKANALCNLGRLPEARACCERGFELGGDLGHPWARARWSRMRVATFASAMKAMSCIRPVHSGQASP